MDGGLKRDAGPVDPPVTSDSGNPSTEDGGLPPSCDSYCDVVMANCQGDDQQYRDRDECVGICSLLPTGKAGETDMGTVGCRAQFAGSPAKTDPSKYCASAGPFGGGACGDRCTAFCQLATAQCMAAEAGAPPYASYASCLTACAGYHYDGDAGESLDGPTTGDTLNCRLFYIRKEFRGGDEGCAQVAAQSPDCRD